MKKNNKYFILSLIFISFLASLHLMNNSKEDVIEKGKNNFYVFNHKKEKDKQPDRPDLALQQDYEMTMDPSLGYPPVERSLEAFEEIKLLKTRLRTAKAPTYKWTERGPNNVGGRTRALMFDPTDSLSKRVFAGGIGGGLWVNEDITDPNVSWSSINDFLPNLSISCISADPRNNKIFYASTGLGYTGRLKGAGIFQSLDAGKSWKQLQSTKNENFDYVQKVLVNTKGRILVSTSKGIFVSLDTAKTWKKTLDGKGADLEMVNDSTFIVSLGFGSTSGEVHITRNYGENWENIIPKGSGSARRIELAVAPSEPNIFYAVADKGGRDTDVAWVRKSTDFGKTWKNLPIPKYRSQKCEYGITHFTRGQAFFDLIIGVHPKNANKVIIGGINLSESSDGGKSWSEISYWTGGGCDEYVHADQHAIAFRPNYPNEAIFGNDGGVFYSSNVGNAPNPDFVHRVKGYNVTTFYCATTKNEINSNYFLAGAQDNGTQQFSEAGLGNTNEVSGGDGAFCFIDEDNPDVQITSYVYNNYYLTTDGWKTAKSISNDSKSGRFINPADYDSKENVLYSVGGVDEYKIIKNIGDNPGSQITITADFGKRQISTIKVSPNQTNRIFVGVRVKSDSKEGRLFRIDNAISGSPSVTEITGNYEGKHGEWVASIDVGESDDQLLATFSNYGVNSVYESTDGGSNWKNKEGNLPDIPVRWGVYNPLNRKQVFIATELGIWKTDDISVESPVWKQINEGMANVKTTMLKVRPKDNVLYAATFGRGLYSTDLISEKSAAEFKSPQVGYVGDEISFTDASLNPNNNWSWDFGDGKSSDKQNPSHAYSKVGKYSVKLKIANGSGEITKQNHITILPKITPPFTAANGGDFESNADYFYPKSEYGDVQVWERGTPKNSMNKAPSGSNVWKTFLSKNVGNSKANFASSLYTPAFDFSKSGNYKLKFKMQMESEFCNAPYGLQIQFTVDNGKSWTMLGSSQPEYDTENWYNRGDNSGCSLERAIFPEKEGWLINLDSAVNVSKSLNQFAGQKSVAFRFLFVQVSGSEEKSYEKDGVLIDDFEVQYFKTSADFSSNKSISYIGSPVKFKYRSNGATSYEWDFGDGTQSTEVNPVHNYKATGNYTVSLKIKSPDGEDTKTKTNLITVLPSYDNPNISLENGGNMESNFQNFIALNVKGVGFTRGKSSVKGKDGTHSGDNAWVIAINDEKYQNLSEAHLYTPLLNFRGLGKYEFKFFANFHFEDQWDGFIVEYTKDKGENWIKLNPKVEKGWYTTLTDDKAIFGPKKPIFSGKTDGFKEFKTDVSALAGNENIGFRFKFLSDPATEEAGLAIDDVTISGPVPGPVVASFTAEGNTGCAGQIVKFSNTSTGSVGAIDWDFGENAVPKTASGIGPHEVFYENKGEYKIKFTVTDFDNKKVIKEDTYILDESHKSNFTYSKNGDGSYLLTASSGDSYQWYGNKQPIEGATKQTYTLGKDDGRLMSVKVKIGHCEVESKKEVVAGIEVEDLLVIYPNPSTGMVNLNESFNDTRYNVFDAVGRMVQSGILTGNLINLQNQANGLYIVEILDNGTTRKAKVLINK